ncbi:MAG TPA: hypothetical protein VGD64_08630, partial [Acidisarcina sp.]
MSPHLHHGQQLATKRVPLVSLLRRGFLTLAIGSVLTVLSPANAQQQDPPQQPTGGFTLKVNTDLVLTNVVARDKKTGEVIRGLTINDFTILENGKPQRIVSFDFQTVDQAAPLNEATISGQAGQGALVLGKTNTAPTPEQLRDHRLI